jgi:hypothetical protein
MRCVAGDERASFSWWFIDTLKGRIVDPLFTAPYLIKLLNVKMEFDVGPFLEYFDSILPSFAQSHSGRKGKLRTHSAVAGVMLLDWSTSWLNWIEALGWIRSF